MGHKKHPLAIACGRAGITLAELARHFGYSLQAMGEIARSKRPFTPSSRIIADAISTYLTQLGAKDGIPADLFTVERLFPNRVRK